MIIAADAICPNFFDVNVRIFLRTTGKARSGVKANPATAARQNAAANGSAFPKGDVDSRAKIAAEETDNNAGRSAHRALVKAFTTA